MSFELPESLAARFGHLKIPLDAEGGILAGKRFCASIQDLLKNQIFKIRPAEAAALWDLVGVIDGNAAPYLPRLAGGKVHPAEGRRSDFPLYCALIRHHDDPQDYSWLHRAALQQLIEDRISATRFIKLPQLICQVLPDHGKALRAALCHIATEIDSGILLKADRVDSLPQWQLLTETERRGIHVALELLAPLTLVGNPPQTPPFLVARDRRAKPPLPIRLGSVVEDNPGLAADLVELPSLVETPSPDAASEKENSDPPPQPRLNKNLERRQSLDWVDLHLAGQLQPETNQSLVPLECIGVYAYRVRNPYRCL